MEAAILPLNLGAVTVNKTALSAAAAATGKAGSEWRVTFTALAGIGVDATALGSADALTGEAAASTVTTVQHGVDALGGTFKLDLGGAQTVDLAANASAAAVMAALRSLPSPQTDGVLVEREAAPEGDGQVLWVVSFSPAAGDVPQLVGVTAPATLAGTDGNVTVTTAAEGAYVQLGGNFTLGLISERLPSMAWPPASGADATTPLAHDATAAQVKAALEALTGTVGVVDVTREAVSGGFEWTVSFTQRGAPRHVGEVGELTVDGANITGTDALAFAEAVVEGYGPAVPVEVTANGVDFTNDRALFEYHEPIVLDLVDPLVGPNVGGTVVTITLADPSLLDAMDVNDTNPFSFGTVSSGALLAELPEEADIARGVAPRVAGRFKYVARRARRPRT